MMKIAIKICCFLCAVSACFGDSIPPQAKDKTPFDFSFITELCWGCFLPIHISGYNLTSSQKDFVTYKTPPPFWRVFCACKKFDLFGFIPLYHTIGLPLTFWEPQAIIEVTRIPNKSMTLIQSAGSIDKKTYKNVGSISNQESGRTSFYNVHYYMYPLARAAFVVPGLDCLKEDATIFVFRTEWLPFWHDMDSKWHWLIDPVRFLYRDHRLQELCKKDCKASNERQPTDAYPWCAGCLGPLYPFCGHVPNHIGGLQASSLLVCRFLALLHSFGSFPGMGKLGLGKGFEPDNFCHKTHSYNLKKTIYKTQLLLPKSDKGQEIDGVKVFCHPLGESDWEWGRSGFTYPIDGEDFVYVVWAKMHCCFNFLEPLKKYLDATKDKKESENEFESLSELIKSILSQMKE
ncbi:MAG TPA: TraU family protein [Chlamydiales bacterium]|nr:TraU family protein [Chlamydiales bacterium]